MVLFIKGRKRKGKVQEVTNQVQHSHLTDWETEAQRGEAILSSSHIYTAKVVRSNFLPHRPESCPLFSTDVALTFFPIATLTYIGCSCAIAKPTSLTSQTQTWNHHLHLYSPTPWSLYHLPNYRINTNTNIKALKIQLKSLLLLLFYFLSYPIPPPPTPTNR